MYNVFHYITRYVINGELDNTLCYHVQYLADFLVVHVHNMSLNFNTLIINQRKYTSL